MRAFIEALRHPENADLAVLEQTGKKASVPSLSQVQTLKALLIAVGVLAGIILLAFILQALHR